MDDKIVNKVALSALITIDLGEMAEKFQPVQWDISQYLHEGLLLKEKDFRQMISTHQWESYKDQQVALFCSTDAIVPMWAWMLVASALQPFATNVYFGNPKTILNDFLIESISNLNSQNFADQRVIVKGCSKYHIDESVFVALTLKLKPVVKSLMFGEPCSTVPVFKKSNN